MASFQRPQRLIIFFCFILLNLSGCSPFVVGSLYRTNEIALASDNTIENEIYHPFQDTIDEPDGLFHQQVNADDEGLSNRDRPFLEEKVLPTVAPTQMPEVDQNDYEAIIEKLELEPLRFTFPIQNAESSSLWRPPLYPVPWEPTTEDHFYFIRPIGANEINWPLANYRYGGVFFEDAVHTGIDIPAPKGTPIMAAGSGKVVWAGYGLYFLRPEFRDPYGLAVAIKHDFGYQGNDIYTVYGHMDELFAYQGQEVQPGDIIGKVGETGKVTGPHLHFEVRLGDNNFLQSRNPELWIAPPQGWGVIAARIMDRKGELLQRQSVLLRNVETNRYWTVLSYGKGNVHADAYYRENMVIGDLPAGKYVIWIKHEGTVYEHTVEVLPGQVSYFRFTGALGYDSEKPKRIKADFNPPDYSPTN